MMGGDAFPHWATYVIIEKGVLPSSDGCHLPDVTTRNSTQSRERP